MPVDACRIEYVEMLPDWERISAVLGGRRSVIAAAETFLPRGRAMEERPEMWRLYVERAMWVGGAARTLDAWTGTLHRKPLMIDVPKRLERRLENIDGAGTNIDVFARNLTRATLSKGSHLVLVDIDQAGLPYLCTYPAECIISWRTRRTANGAVLDHLVLRERTEAAGEDGFGIVYADAYRVLDLDENNEYRVRLFIKSQKGDALIDEVYPTRGGYRINFIPAVFSGAVGNQPGVQKPPISDVVEANISLYQSSADLEYSRYWTASPTAVVTGMEDAGFMTWQMGGGAMWSLPAGATASFLEFKGSGLASLENAVTEKREIMASLGARLLSAPKRMVETAEALTIKSAGESASLVSVADSVSTALTTALRYALWWWDYSSEWTLVQLSKDLTNIRLQPDDLKALMLAVQSGLLSLDDYFYNLQMGEILRPGLTIEEAKASIAAQSPQISVGYDLPAQSAKPRDEDPTNDNASTIAAE